MATTRPAYRPALVERAAALAAEQFAGRADRYDHEALFPVENFEDLHREGLLALTVPEAYGGVGASWQEYVQILKCIGKACGSTALTFNMHCSVMRILDGMASDEQKERYFSAVVKDGKYFATLTSEPQTSFRGKFTFQTFAKANEDGSYTINGSKHFCSLAGYASYYFTWTFLEQAESVEEGLINMVVAADNPGVRIERTWDTMAMRGTRSDSVHFQECRVPPEDVVGLPGDIVRKGLPDTFVLGYVAAYLGIAEAALDYAINFAKHKTFLPNPQPISHSVTIQRHIGEMQALVEAGTLAMTHAARLRDEGVDSRTNTHALSLAKYLAGEAAYRVTDKALLVVGGRGISRTQPLQRYIRDARAAHVMPPSGDACIEMVGRIALGLPVIDLFGRELA